MAEPNKIQETPPKGEYHPAGPDDLRSPCPVLNSLANHGIIARDGRNITAAELKSAVRYLGLGIDVATVLVNGSFQVHSDDPKKTGDGARLGLRDRDQVNKDGVPVLNLDQVGRPHATEHDVSITRQDRALGDCIRADPVLLKRFLAAPRADQGYSASDLGRYRKTRFEEQRSENPELDFDRQKHYIACLEVGAIECVFGEGFPYRVPERYIQALFAEERLPLDQGWKPRRIPMMLLELGVVVLRISHFAWPF
ncbi:putative peroxidase [Aspergillus clavatus NRRL 1]|uniref:Peroxidase, putative n=1 Tax=Aspergillus clavatus (strain ATCC 1007 / CBS 513.65 / DSM 816 / NCTC 3887 / NRRL 1 / QM 1276 / 107) TaxID=344612 RepID=A1C5B6_ASPCL|nr:peroxidase, putative [Aspergillus clavatus NRRL 1]EAW14884.1 peroxidase, putative [Aspergillus clavatus NRRL 1]